MFNERSSFLSCHLLFRYRFYLEDVNDVFILHQTCHVTLLNILSIQLKQTIFKEP